MDNPYATYGTGDELVVGYAPAFRGVSGWRHVFRQQRPAPKGGVVRRVTFDNIEDPHKRLLIDVAEFPTPEDARAQLEAARADANFETSAGPARFGSASFAYPAQNSRSLYFCRTNLMIWVYACGREAVYVTPWAEQIMDDLEAERLVEPGSGLVLTAAPEQREAGQPIQLNVSSRWDQGEWAWRKFKATGGTVARTIEGDGVLFWPRAGDKDAALTGWTIEPGRPTYSAVYSPGR